MILASIHRTWLFCLALTLFLFQVPEISYLPKAIGFMLIFIICIKTILDNKTSQFHLSHLALWAFGFITYICLSLTWSGILYESLSWFLTYLTIPIIVISATLSNQPFINIKIFTNYILLLGVLCGFGAIVQVIYNLGIYPNAANYPFYDPNSLAIFLGLSALIAFNNLYKTPQTRHKAILTLAILTIFSGIILTGSRGIIISVIGCFTIQLFFYGAKKAKENIIPIIVCLIGFIILPLALENIIERDTVINSLNLHGFLAGRIIIWDSVVQIIQSTHLWIGNGIGTFRNIYLEYRNIIDPSMGVHAHNDILHIWVELGLIGVIFAVLIGVLIFIQFVKIWKTKSHLQFLPIILVIFTAMGAMMTSVIMLTSIVLIIGLCLTTLQNEDSLHIKRLKNHHSITALFLMLLCGLNVLIAMDSFAMSKIRADIQSGDIQSMLKNINRTEKFSLGLNPSAPIFKISALLALHDTNTIAMEQKKDALNEIKIYLNDAKKLNPFNPEILYYHGQLALRLKNENLAINYLEKALKLDPTYLAARVGLINLYSNPDQKLKLIEDGLKLEYWKQNPSKFYGLAIMTATQLRAPKLAAKAQENLNNLLLLK